MSGVDYAYRYEFASSLEPVNDGRLLRLATSGGIEKNPHFFTGRIVNPRVTCDYLLAVSEVARTRFYFQNELRNRLLAADPVVTSGGERLRFESFSACCGVYARLDLKPEAIDGDWTGRGTTNVDFNQPMRGALAGVLQSEPVGLNVGDHGVELEVEGNTVVEKKVKLPVRWLKGFVEVQAYQSRMKPAFEAKATDLRQLLRGLGEHKTWQKGSRAYLVPAGRSVRLSQREGSGAVAIGAPARLKFVEPLLRHAQLVRFYGGEDGVAGLEIILPHASMHIVLSPDASRGFSGEGQALLHLVDQSGKELSSRVRSQLKWQAKLDISTLAGTLEAGTDAVKKALDTLGTQGLVGYDLSESAFFHRELPFDLNIIDDLNPRLKKARQLLADGGVRITARSELKVEGYVRGTEVEHRVVLDEEGRCTCTWYADHGGRRGPCSHVLALELAVDRDG